MQTVNIFSQEIRNRKRFDLECVEGCWVELYDDVTLAQIEKAQEGIDSADSATNVLTSQIADWNLADDKGKLEISQENLKRLPVKIFIEISKLQAKAINAEAFTEKKSESAEN